MIGSPLFTLQSPISFLVGFLAALELCLGGLGLEAGALVDGLALQGLFGGQGLLRRRRDGGGSGRHRADQALGAGADQILPVRLEERLPEFFGLRYWIRARCMAFSWGSVGT